MDETAEFFFFLIAPYSLCGRLNNYMERQLHGTARNLCGRLNNYMDLLKNEEFLFNLK
ncbi:hypothetical protein BpHYR1_015279 [Brachionus plicatilis]|uniref:Uncharacterized protein n=1 Tax=Brachionus plicatilis TaxID=10195 RepID=A0A3M7Q8C5_BRAPC|nr:hypothetical protein BpHYR1_015279 [Brachionus plicatilis]